MIPASNRRYYVIIEEELKAGGAKIALRREVVPQQPPSDSWQLPGLVPDASASKSANEATARSQRQRPVAEDMPEVYRIIDNFQWSVEDMQSVMLDLQDVGPEAAARTWVDENQDKVTSWLE